MAPKAPFTGMNNITWIGFGHQFFGSPIPVGVVNMTVSSLPNPKKVDNQNAFYQEVLLVDPSFKPGNPVTQPPTKGNWFVRRQALSVKDGKTQVLQTTNLAINKKAEATSLADLNIPFSATHLEYRLGRKEKIIGKAEPGKLPKISTIDVFPHDAVRIAVPVAAVIATTCQVKGGVTRPIPCEFQMVKFQIVGKSGKVVYETSSVEKGAIIQIPKGEEKKNDGQSVYFDAKWIVKRIHKPNFPVNKGYLVSWGQTGSDFSAEIDAHEPLISGVQLDATLGKEFTIPFEVKNSAPGGGFSVKVGELILENDVTKTKYPKTQFPGSLRAEAYVKLNWTPAP